MGSWCGESRQTLGLAVGHPCASLHTRPISTFVPCRCEEKELNVHSAVVVFYMSYLTNIFHTLIFTRIMCILMFLCSFFLNMFYNPFSLVSPLRCLITFLFVYFVPSVFLSVYFFGFIVFVFSFIVHTFPCVALFVFSIFISFLFVSSSLCVFVSLSLCLSFYLIVCPLTGNRNSPHGSMCRPGASVDGSLNSGPRRRLVVCLRACCFCARCSVSVLGCCAWVVGLCEPWRPPLEAAAS